MYKRVRPTDRQYVKQTQLTTKFKFIGMVADGTVPRPNQRMNTIVKSRPAIEFIKFKTFREPFQTFIPKKGMFKAQNAQVKCSHELAHYWGTTHWGHCPSDLRV